jgi:serine/threonine-protein phosphatase 5
MNMIKWFLDGKTLPKRYVWEIVLGAHEHFAQEKSLVNVDLEDGVTCDVIGDIHGMFFHVYLLWDVLTVDEDTQGQFYDMLHLFRLTGNPGNKHFLLMNGDLVDRGSWSMEVILTAFAFKCE